VVIWGMTVHPWLRWIALHLLGKTLALCLGLSLLVGAFLYVVPGRVDTTLPVRSEGASAEIEAPRQGFLSFYRKWAGHLISGELGRNTHGYPVIHELAERVPVTAGLAGGAMLLVSVFSLLGALLLVRSTRRPAARFGVGTIYVVTALPTFFIAYLLIALVPSQNNIGSHYLLPILVLAASDGLVAELMRTLGGGIAAELARPYADMAVVKGLRVDAFLPLPGTVLFHAFRQAIIQVLPRTALQMQALVGLSFLVEKIFSLEGLGDMLLDGLGERDVNRVLVVVLITALLVRAMSLLNDLLILALNPRARTAA
jgi:peptide/nickel transport system permease protein